MLGSISATDGHACMLRAMCEASAAPLHSDGLLGDALNLLLSAGHALVGGSDEDIGSYREYSEAQTEGMVRRPMFTKRMNFSVAEKRPFTLPPLSFFSSIE